MTVLTVAGQKASYEPEYVRLPLSDLHVDRDNYQRDPDEAQIRDIMEHFDPIAFGNLWVNERKQSDGGGLYVFDGQNRLTAVRRLKHTHAPAILVRGLSPAEEAERFVLMDTQRRGLTTMYLFRARVFHEDPVALLVLRTIEESGFQVDLNPSTWTNLRPGYIRAIGAVEKSIRQYGAPVTVTALQTLRFAWPNKTEPSYANFISGMSKLIFKFNDVMKIDRLQRKLAEANPADLVKAANALRENQSATMHEIFGRLFYQQYLKDTRAETRAQFPAWDSRIVRPSGRGDGSMQLIITAPALPKQEKK